VTNERSFRTLEEALTKLTQLKDQSLIRRVAVHEVDKEKIAEIFERINQAREQLVVRLYMTTVVIHVSCFFSPFV
jgi:hypothetical protein